MAGMQPKAGIERRGEKRRGEAGKAMGVGWGQVEFGFSLSLSLRFLFFSVSFSRVDFQLLQKGLIV